MLSGYNGGAAWAGGLRREGRMGEELCGAEGTPWGMVVLYGMTAFTAFVGSS